MREVREHELYTHTPNAPALPDHSVAAHRVLTAALIGAREDGGEAALLLVQVGPVQPFIDASRRTRDLWAGSYLMSLMSAKVVACLMKELGPEAIITPQPESSALLKRIVYGDKDVTDSDALQPALPAKVMALVPRGRAEELGEACISAVEEVWRKLWDECAEAVKGSGVGEQRPGWDEGAERQRDAFLERSYTVQPWPRHAQAVWAYVDKLQSTLKTPARHESVKGSLGASYGELSGALWAIHSAQRDATPPPPHHGDPRFKCHVCGQREALGPQGGQRAFWSALAGKVGSFELKPTEQLCAICLMKRLGVVKLVAATLKDENNEKLRREVRSYPSVPSLACAPFRYEMIRALQADTDPAPGGARAVIGGWVDTITPALDALYGENRPKGRCGVAKIQALVDTIVVSSVDDDLIRLVKSIDEIDGPWFDEDAYEPERAWTEQIGKRPNHATQDAFRKAASALLKEDPQEHGEPEVPPRPFAFAYALLKAGPLWKKVVDLFKHKFGYKPSHYVAALYLDGDQLSKWLNGSHKCTPRYRDLMPATALAALVSEPHLKDLPEFKRAVSPALQGELSARLSALAGRAVKEVVDEHFGRLVYCGGDDVVALLPATHALQCAEALAKLIQEARFLGDKVTVSAGIHIQHQREPLGRLIGGARKAERLSKTVGEPKEPSEHASSLEEKAELMSKEGRDALTITLTPRSGDGLTLTVPWKVDGLASTVERICNIARIINKYPAERSTQSKPTDDSDKTLSASSWVDERGESSLTVKLGHVLRSELMTLGYQPDGRHRKRRPNWRTLQPIIESRVLALADAVGPKNSERRDALNLPLALLEADKGDPDRLVKTLLLARFLARETLANGDKK